MPATTVAQCVATSRSHCCRFNELLTINLILSWLALGEPEDLAGLLEKAPRYHLYLATGRVSISLPLETVSGLIMKID